MTENVWVSMRFNPVTTKNNIYGIYKTPTSAIIAAQEALYNEHKDDEGFTDMTLKSMIDKSHIIIRLSKGTDYFWIKFDKQDGDLYPDGSEFEIYKYELEGE